MKRLIILLTVLVFVLSGCSEYEPTADQVQKIETEKLMKEVNNQIGLPDIQNFYEKKMAKDVFELRDDSSLVTYAYFQNLDGRFVYLGQCIGFGLPYSVQYTNPEVYKGQGGSIPQADPNGLFMPDGLSATWLMLINEDTGEREIIYSEPSIIVTQSKMSTRLCAKWSLPTGYVDGFVNPDDIVLDETVTVEE